MVLRVIARCARARGPPAPRAPCAAAPGASRAAPAPSPSAARAAGARRPWPPPAALARPPWPPRAPRPLLAQRGPLGAGRLRGACLLGRLELGGGHRRGDRRIDARRGRCRRRGRVELPADDLVGALAVDAACRTWRPASRTRPCAANWSAGSAAISESGGSSRVAASGVGTPRGDSTVTSASPMPSEVMVVLDVVVRRSWGTCARSCAGRRHPRA